MTRTIRWTGTAEGEIAIADEFDGSGDSPGEEQRGLPEASGAPAGGEGGPEATLDPP